MHPRHVIPVTVRTLICVMALLASPMYCFAAASSAEAGDAAQGFDHSHTAWDKILRDHVVFSGGASSVRYKNLKSNPAQLTAYLKALSQVSQAEFDSFSRDQQLAMLINAYNAYTVKLILDNYPISSIKKIGGWFKGPWKQKFFSLLGKERTLDEVEHEMIRPRYKEARIHFAVVCASRGCPRLHNRAYTADKLDAQLDASAKTFLNDKDRNRYDAKAGRLQISKIFKWYAEDFEEAAGSVQAWVAPYMATTPEQKTTIGNESVKISYLDYDWSLNEVQ